MSTTQATTLPATSFVRNEGATPAKAVHSHLHPTPSWQVADHPMPNGREEVWRFTPIERMAALLTEPAEGVERADIDIALPEVAGLSLTRITPDQARERAVEPPVDRVSALAATYAVSPVLVRVDRNVCLDQPVDLVITGGGVDNPVFAHTIIEIGESAEVTLIMKHTGAGCLAHKVDIVVGDNAHVNFVSLQDWDDHSLHGVQLSVRVGRDAQIQTVQASVAGGLTRIIERADYAGPGGDLNQLGLYFVDGERHVEHRMFVDHNQPSTVSNVDYRGALQNKGAHAVWVGDVLIRPEAVGINTYESNKNLLLTEGCQADAVPNLEIETGDIEGAGHSASTGRFDDLQLFYLCSRGIPEDEAKRLIVKGFFYDIIHKIGIESVEERLIHVIDHDLQTSAA